MTVTTLLTSGTGVEPHTVLYGYVRPCGRTVLVTEDEPGNNLQAMWEVIDDTLAPFTGFVQPVLHNRMLAAAPGETVTYRRKLRKLTDEELQRHDGRTYGTPALDARGGPVPPPAIMRRFDPAAVIPGAHECSACEWA